jgi:predicted branched-subunit amino acid permease
MPDASSTAGNGPRFTAHGLVRGGQRLLPVSVFVLPFGVAYGAAAIEAGLSADQAMVMSLVVFAGASQFAALDLWQSRCRSCRWRLWCWRSMPAISSSVPRFRPM